MIHKFRIFTVRINAGYYVDQSEANKALLDKYPEHRCTSAGSMMHWYSPKVPRLSDGYGPPEGEKWEPWAKEQNKEVLAERYPYWDSFNLDVEESEYLSMLDADVKHEFVKVVTRTANITPLDQSGQLDMNIELMRQLLELNDKTVAQLQAASAEMFNQKCQVHMPGIGLSSFNELMLCEDPCTDALQDKLDKGWRIIAACPQPDSRRPDYVLGRFNPNHEQGGGAERGY